MWARFGRDATLETVESLSCFSMSREDLLDAEPLHEFNDDFFVIAAPFRDPIDKFDPVNRVKVPCMKPWGFKESKFILNISLNVLAPDVDSLIFDLLEL